MNTTPLIRTFLALAVCSVSLTACGNSDCDVVYEHLKKCEAGDAKDFPSKSAFTPLCEEQKSKSGDEFSSMVECAKKSSCDEAKKCSRMARLKGKIKEAEKAVADGNWGDALDFCKFKDEEYKASEEVRAVCDKAFTDGLAKLAEGGDIETPLRTCRFSDDMKKVSETFKTGCAKAAGVILEKQLASAHQSRDAGKRDYKLCLELQDTGKLIGDSATAKVESACAELDIAEQAKKAIDAAKANITAKKSDLPWECGSALEKIGKVSQPSEWINSKKAELLKTCYLDLGKTIVSAELPGMKYVCPFRVKKLKEAMAKHGLQGKDAALDSLVSKTDKLCSKG